MRACALAFDHCLHRGLVPALERQRLIPRKTPVLDTANGSWLRAGNLLQFIAYPGMIARRIDSTDGNAQHSDRIGRGQRVQNGGGRLEQSLLRSPSDRIPIHYEHDQAAASGCGVVGMRGWRYWNRGRRSGAATTRRRRAAVAGEQHLARLPRHGHRKVSRREIGDRPAVLVEDTRLQSEQIDTALERGGGCVCCE